jgi:hypothetical protein
VGTRNTQNLEDMVRHQFSLDGAEITKAGLADRTTTKTLHLDVYLPVVSTELRLYAADIFMNL